MKKLLLAGLIITIIIVCSGCTININDNSDKNDDVVKDDITDEIIDEVIDDVPNITDEVVYEVLFTTETMPKIDGSTANIPLAELILKRITDMDQDEIDKRINFTTTPNSYMNLGYGSTNLLLVYEADDETKQQLIDYSYSEFEYYEIGLDALVFLTNINNPVDSITTQQLQDIYTGKITNWKELGGEDKPIVPFQRIEKSGSQALMRKLVMGNLEMTQAPEELAPGEMGGLMTALADYDNESNSIGYSVYYYAKNMFALPNLKLLAIDGVAPSNATIADASYPFINPFFAVIRKDTAADSNERKLLNWILSDKGKQTIIDSGYVAVIK